MGSDICILRVNSASFCFSKVSMYFPYLFAPHFEKLFLHSRREMLGAKTENETLPSHKNNKMSFSCVTKGVIQMSHSGAPFNQLD